MKILIRKNKIFLIFTSFIVGLGLLLLVAQINSIQVSAEIKPITVLEEHLDFGAIFPGEGQKQVNFTVQLIPDYDGSDVYYKITQKVKPKPGAVVPEGYTGNLDEYCQEYPEDVERCFQNLCPYLTKINLEGEGDLENQARVGLGDSADVWTINFEAPAIFGATVFGQSDEVITESGVYGCDVGVVLLPEGGCQDTDGDGFYLEGGDCGDIDCNDDPEAGGADIYPGATEICDDGIDNDCDELVDAADVDCQVCSPEETRDCETGQPGICQAGIQTCESSGLWGTCLRLQEPSDELCDDGLDNDCDGLVDNDDTDDCGQGGPTYQCSDSVDNDDDGYIDYPDDPGCDSAEDDDEAGVAEGPPVEPTPQEEIRGGGGPPLLILHTESSLEVQEVNVVVVWFTSYPATSRVVYDTVSHSLVGSPPNYGYAFSTTEDANKVTYHQVTLMGLTPGTTYYWRGVSHGSPEIFTEEFTFTTAEAAEAVPPVAGPEVPPGAAPVPPGIPVGERAWQTKTPGIVLGAESPELAEQEEYIEPEVDGKIGNVGMGAEVGAVLGEEGEVQVIEEAEPEAEVQVKEITPKEQITVTPEVEAKEVGPGYISCQQLIWLLLLISLLLIAAIYYKERRAFGAARNSWAFFAVLAILPAIIWYPACGLVWWLIILIIGEIIYIIRLVSQNGKRGSTEISGLPPVASKTPEKPTLKPEPKKPVSPKPVSQEPSSPKRWPDEEPPLPEEPPPDLESAERPPINDDNFFPPIE